MNNARRTMQPQRRRRLHLLALLHKGRRGWRALRGSTSYLREERSLFYKTVWSEAASAVGATATTLDGSLLEISSGSNALRIWDNYTSLDDPVTLRIAGNKPLVHRLLGQQGLPVPSYCHCAFDDMGTAAEFMAGCHGPFVVKPARYTGSGDGVTAAISGQKALARAMALAGAYCPEIIVEQQIQGDNYRLLYLDGELLDAVLRQPPSVVGDGKSNIRGLIAKENRRRHDQGYKASQTLLRVDWELKQTLRQQGLTLRSVPAAALRIALKAVVSENCRDDNERVGKSLSPSITYAGSAAAKAVGVRLAGVDIVTPDPEVPLEEAGGAIIEINTTPGLYYHYMTRAGSYPVAGAILERVFRTTPVECHPRESGSAS